jgi:hypothetical protein
MLDIESQAEDRYRSNKRRVATFSLRRFLRKTSTKLGLTGGVSSAIILIVVLTVVLTRGGGGTGDDSVCSPLVPIPFSIPTNGTCSLFVNQTMASGDACTFSCLDGYELSGNKTTCVDGLVNYQSCLGPCSNITSPLHGGMGSCNETLASGVSCSMTCETGYSLSHNDSTCNFGLFTPQQCVANDCLVHAPLHGTIGNCSNALASGYSCQMACDLGYALQGNETTCTLGVLATQQCTEKPCSNIVAPTHGSFGNCSEFQASGSVCNFECNAGYSLSATNSSCSAGIWTPQVCAGNECLAIEAPMNGTLGNCTTIQASGSACQFECNNGTSLVGATSFCDAGVWSPQTCVA